MATSSEESEKNSNHDVWIQEQPKTKGTAGERAWGPYRIHEGSDITSKFAGGPYGLGDPDDRTLRKVEEQIMIPQLMKKKSKTEYCAEQYKKFFDCAGEKGGALFPFLCRTEAKILRECMATMQNDQEFRKQCTEEYLDQRSEYRRTGKRKRLIRM